MNICKYYSLYQSNLNILNEKIYYILNKITKYMHIIKTNYISPKKVLIFI